jgi:iron-sulfur cluster repair protein YtfE (RIC family)
MYIRGVSPPASSADDVVADLEHDHVGLTELVSELRGMVAAVQHGGARPEALAHRFHDLAQELREALLHHFGEEEELLFPFLVEVRPELEAEVRALAAAHDGVCGAALQLSAVAARGPEGFARRFVHVAALFERLDHGYGEHARLERAFLRRADGLLAPDERARLAALRA